LVFFLSFKLPLENIKSLSCLFDFLLCLQVLLICQSHGHLLHHLLHHSIILLNTHLLLILQTVLNARLPKLLSRIQTINEHVFNYPIAVRLVSSDIHTTIQDYEHHVTVFTFLVKNMTFSKKQNRAFSKDLKPNSLFITPEKF